MGVCVLCNFYFLHITLFSTGESLKIVLNGFTVFILQVNKIHYFKYYN